MRAGIVWLASLLAFPLAGWPLLGHSAYRKLGLVARFVLGGAAGCVAVTTAMTLFTLCHWTWHPILLVIAGTIISAGARLFVRSRNDVVSRVDQSRLGFPSWVSLAVIFASACTAVLAASSASATSPDLVLFWGPKAMAFAEARGIDAGYLANPLFRYQHLSYPPLIPNAYAFASLVAGRFSWMAAVMTFPLLLAALVLALPGALREWCSRRSALIAAACVAASLAFIGQRYLVAGNADFALLLFEILGLAILLSSRASDKNFLLLAGILFSGATSAKVEGLPFVAAAALLFLLIHPRQVSSSRAAAAVLILGPSAIMLAIWFTFEKLRLGFLGYESYGPFLAANWRGVGQVLWKVAQALASAGWGLPWIVPAAALAVAFPISRESLVPLGVAVVLGVFFIFTYLHGGDPTLWISWSAGRIFAVISPLLVLASIRRRPEEALPNR